MKNHQNSSRTYLIQNAISTLTKLAPAFALGVISLSSVAHAYPDAALNPDIFYDPPSDRSPESVSLTTTGGRHAPSNPFVEPNGGFFSSA